MSAPLAHSVSTAAAARTPDQLSDLDTPALVLDRRILEANLTRMRQGIARHNVLLRPHLKTAKCLAIADLATQSKRGPITVSTLVEAEVLAGHGYRDIIYAVGITPAKAARAARLLAAGVDLKVVVDQAAAARELAAAGHSHRVVFPVLIEVDCGDHRAGVAADDPELLEVAAALRAGGCRVRGVITHAGHSYAGREPDDFARYAQEEVTAARIAAARLAQAGHHPDIVSVGSSPTARHGRDFAGVTEVRAGVYMFNDLYQAGIGACTRSDIALTVLASVIHHQPARNELVIDAGALALSKDRSTAVLPPDRDALYGLVADLDGNVVPGFRVARVSQEHGSVIAEAPIPFARFPVGARVRVLPNHACLTAAPYACYHVVSGGTEITAVWPRFGGW